MKKSLFTLAIVAVFAACNNTPKPEDITTTTTSTTASSNGTDTSGLGQFEQWKEQQKTVTVEGVTDNTEVSQPAQAVQRVTEAPAPRIIYRDRPASTPRVAKVTKPRTYGTPSNPTRDASSRNEGESPKTGTVDVPTAGTDAGVGSGTGKSNEPVATTPTEVPENNKNKGWSKAAKGTVIGAGSGAVLGAIISKNKGKGAVIGGVIGAAGGYVLGKKQDKKDTTY
jgi:hypothetical protein